MNKREHHLDIKQKLANEIFKIYTYFGRETEGKYKKSLKLE